LFFFALTAAANGIHHVIEYVEWAKKIVAGLCGTSRGWNSSLMMLQRRGRVNLSPMTPTTSPISTAPEHEHYQNNNQDQFHGISPLRTRSPNINSRREPKH
jgi:hypothetical protein